MKAHSLVWGAALLLICNFISRVLGFIYRIALVRVIGTEGIGLTEMITPIYSFSLVIASFSLPLAMSRLIANQLGKGNYQNIQKIWHISMSLIIALGAVTTVFIYLASPWLIDRFVIDSRTLRCFQVIIPAIFIVTVCSGYRGYFQGIKQIGVIGFSQNLEQIVRVGAGLGLASYLLPYGLETTVIAISLATVMGELAGLIYIMLLYRKFKITSDLKPTLSTGKITSYMFQVAAPVTAQKIFMSFLLMLQAFIIPWTLQQAGMDVSMATKAYGNFSGVAMALIHLPAIFTSTLAMAILPAVAESNSSFDMLSSRVNQSIHITTTISLPFMVIFFFYAQELCIWLFKAPEAAGALQILALGAVFIYEQSTITSILQGLGNVKALSLNLLISGIAFLIGLYILTPLPWLGIKGSAIAFVIFAFINCTLNLFYLIKTTGMKLNWNLIIVKPIISSIVGIIAMKIAANLLAATVINQYAFKLSCMGVFALAYFLGLLLLGGVPRLLFKYFLRNS